VIDWHRIGPSLALPNSAGMPGAPNYGEALSPLPGRCFRLVAHHGEAGPGHCPEPVAWRGSWRAPNGRRDRIKACEGHRPAADENSGPTA
jgi:hypothetical protein